MPPRADPIRVWYFLRGGSALGDTLVWTLAPVYFVRTVGMSPLQLVLVGTFMELTIFACEIPTGIVADVVSRRLSVVIGYLVARSTFAPRWLGIWLALAGLAWCTFVLPGAPYAARLVLMAFGGLSEVALLLWLAVLAVRR